MIWIEVHEALAVHSMSIAEFGGRFGVRDAGLLESALARPKNIAAYEPDADVAQLAAAYAGGVIKNHPFIDGNKRTGYVVMEMFLILNGFELEATQMEKYPIVIGVADGSLSEEKLADWLRARLIAAKR